MPTVVDCAAPLLPATGQDTLGSAGTAGLAQLRIPSDPVDPRPVSGPAGTGSSAIARGAGCGPAPAR